jgi:hypothetical protein
LSAILVLRAVLEIHGIDETVQTLDQITRLIIEAIVFRLRADDGVASDDETADLRATIRLMVLDLLKEHCLSSSTR